MTSRKRNTVVLNSEHLQNLLDALSNRGYETIGPTLGDGAIVFDKIQTIDDFPVGWSDRHGSGSYQLLKGKRMSFFGYTVGVHSLKRFLNPPDEQLLKAHRDGHGFTVTDITDEPPKVAFIGVRPCELHALAIQDKVFVDGQYVNSFYRRRRQGLFLVAVNCLRPGETCFCASMKTGPRAISGFDLLMTEMIESNRHYFLIETGSDAGNGLLDELPVTKATEDEKETVEKALQRATAKMGRSLDTADIKELLYRNFDHPHWEEVADRCLCCGNCTMVCPTCFCGNVEDVTDLSGQQAERWSRWDSCFARDFSYIHGGSIRFSARSRFRQWMTHKLAYWLDQFGSFGCVGCGRCITWCPAGIDITEEAREIREKESTTAG